MAQICRIGTRKSALAKTQSQWVLQRVQSLGLECQLVELTSDGDADRDTPLYSMEMDTPGVFCKRLQKGLLAGEIDLAVHSLKDLPTESPRGLEVLAVPERESSLDVLLIRPQAFRADGELHLYAGAVVGTSSLRREAQIQNVRKDATVIPIRGNVPTRIEKLRSGEVDAIVLAQAGIRRLGIALDGLHCVELTGTRFVGAAGQGALAIEARSDWEGAESIRHLDDFATRTATGLERSLLRALEGGCTLPLGARCEHHEGSYQLRAFLGQYQTAGTERRWVGFHPFESTSSSLESLLKEAVQVLRPYAP